MITNAQENSTKFRTAACATINTLLENSETIMISKWQNMLERQAQDNSGAVQSESLGTFLRLLHYYLITMVSGEKDFQLLQSEIRLCGTLLHVTPYSKMLPGLPTLLITSMLQSQLAPSNSLLAKWT